MPEVKICSRIGCAGMLKRLKAAKAEFLSANPAQDGTSYKYLFHLFFCLFIYHVKY